MDKKINIFRVTSVSLSVANLAFSLLPLMIVAEYAEALIKHQTYRLAYNSVTFDIAAMIFGLVIFIYSAMVIIRYFRNKMIKPQLSIIIFIFYVLTVLIPVFVGVE